MNSFRKYALIFLFIMLQTLTDKRHKSYIKVSYNISQQQRRGKCHILIGHICWSNDLWCWGSGPGYCYYDSPILCITAVKFDLKQKEQKRERWEENPSELIIYYLADTTGQSILRPYLFASYWFIPQTTFCL